MTPANLRQLLSCIDLTSLNTDDTPEKITALCKKARTEVGDVAAVCIYPPFVAQAWSLLIDSPVKIATVANFPAGKEDFAAVKKTMQQAILDGAHEIDVVIPYHYYQQQNRQAVKDFISSCKQICGTQTVLKTILETGTLTPEQIQFASEDAINAGSDFLKTSTGKIPVGATPEAATILLEAIKKSNRPIGFKASGGVRTIEQAQQYIELTRRILGENAITPERFRIGASTLLDNLLEEAHATHR